MTVEIFGPGGGVNVLNVLVPEPFDEIDLSYVEPGRIDVVTYKNAGSTVATLTLTYSGDDISKVVRT